MNKMPSKFINLSCQVKRHLGISSSQVDEDNKAFKFKISKSQSSKCIKILNELLNDVGKEITVTETNLDGLPDHMKHKSLSDISSDEVEFDVQLSQPIAVKIFTCMVMKLVLLRVSEERSSITQESSSSLDINLGNISSSSMGRRPQGFQIPQHFLSLLTHIIRSNIVFPTSTSRLPITKDSTSSAIVPLLRTSPRIPIQGFEHIRRRLFVGTGLRKPLMTPKQKRRVVVDLLLKYFELKCQEGRGGIDVFIGSYEIIATNLYEVVGLSLLGRDRVAYFESVKEYTAFKKETARLLFNHVFIPDIEKLCLRHSTTIDKVKIFGFNRLFNDRLVPLGTDIDFKIVVCNDTKFSIRNAKKLRDAIRLLIKRYSGTLKPLGIDMEAEDFLIETLEQLEKDQESLRSSLFYLGNMPVRNRMIVGPVCGTPQDISELFVFDYQTLMGRFVEMLVEAGQIHPTNQLSVFANLELLFNAVPTKKREMKMARRVLVRHKQMLLRSEGILLKNKQLFENYIQLKEIKLHMEEMIEEYGKMRLEYTNLESQKKELLKEPENPLIKKGVTKKDSKILKKNKINLKKLKKIEKNMQRIFNFIKKNESTRLRYKKIIEENKRILTKKKGVIKQNILLLNCLPPNIQAFNILLKLLHNEKTLLLFRPHLQTMACSTLYVGKKPLGGKETIQTVMRKIGPQNILERRLPFPIKYGLMRITDMAFYSSAYPQVKLPFDLRKVEELGIFLSNCVCFSSGNPFLNPLPQYSEIHLDQLERLSGNQRSIVAMYIEALDGKPPRKDFFAVDCYDALWRIASKINKYAQAVEVEIALQAKIQENQLVVMAKGISKGEIEKQEQQIARAMNGLQKSLEKDVKILRFYKNELECLNNDKRLYKSKSAIYKKLKEYRKIRPFNRLFKGTLKKFSEMSLLEMLPFIREAHFVLLERNATLVGPFLERREKELEAFIAILKTDWTQKLRQLSHVLCSVFVKEPLQAIYPGFHIALCKINEGIQAIDTLLMCQIEHPPQVLSIFLLKENIAELVHRIDGLLGKPGQVDIDNDHFIHSDNRKKALDAIIQALKQAEEEEALEALGVYVYQHLTSAGVISTLRKKSVDQKVIVDFSTRFSDVTNYKFVLDPKVISVDIQRIKKIVPHFFPFQVVGDMGLGCEDIVSKEHEHTIPFTRYLKVRLSQSLVLFMKKHNDKIEIFLGSRRDLYEFYCGIQHLMFLGEFGGKTSTQFCVFQDTSSIGNLRIVLTNIPSNSRLRHQLFQLRYSGIDISAIKVRGSLSIVRDEELRLLGNYLDSIISRGNFPTRRMVCLLGSQITAINILRNDKDFEPLKPFTIGSLRVAYCFSKNVRLGFLGFRMPNGDAAYYVTQLLLQKRFREFVMVGAGGSFPNKGNAVGMYQVLSGAVCRQGEFFLHPKYILPNVKYLRNTVFNPNYGKNMTVDSPLEETVRWFKFVIDKYSCVDVETAHIFRAFCEFIQTSQEEDLIGLNLCPGLFFSDVVSEHALIGKINVDNAYQKMKEFFELLGLLSSDKDE